MGSEFENSDVSKVCTLLFDECKSAFNERILGAIHPARLPVEKIGWKAVEPFLNTLRNLWQANNQTIVDEYKMQKQELLEKVSFLFEAHVKI